MNSSGPTEIGTLAQLPSIGDVFGELSHGVMVGNEQLRDICRLVVVPG